MTAAQQALMFEAPVAIAQEIAEPAVAAQNAVTDAFADGRLRVEVDDPRPALSVTVHFVKPEGLDASDTVRLVHVISKPAGGEIRTYVIARGVLCLVGPARHHKWPELDDAVAAATSTPLLPYAMSRANASMPVRCE